MDTYCYILSVIYFFLEVSVIINKISFMSLMKNLYIYIYILWICSFT